MVLVATRASKPLAFHFSTAGVFIGAHTCEPNLLSAEKAVTCSVEQAASLNPSLLGTCAVDTWLHHFGEDPMSSKQVEIRVGSQQPINEHYRGRGVLLGGWLS